MFLTAMSLTFARYQRFSVLLAVCLLDLLAGSHFAWTDEIEQHHVYDLAIQAAAPMLPEIVRQAIEANSAAFRDGFLLEGQAASDKAAAARHFVCLDVAAAEGDATSRRKAAADFPRRQADARKLYEEHKAEACGFLPWVIEEEFGHLFDAFASKDGGAAARQAGVLAHFAMDAALPFNTTVLAHSPANVAGSEGSGSNSSAQPAAHSMRLADRFHGALVQRLHDRLAFEIRVWPGRSSPQPEPLPAAFRTLLAAREAAEELLVIDAELLAELGSTGGAVSAASADLYLAGLSERAAPLMRTQIEAGALLATNLIHAAWIKAGRPELNAVTPATTAEEPKPDAPTAAEPAFLGSLGSSIYHRPGCTHCARIKPENTVRFATPAEADAAGRKPCRACRPDQ